jgi:hypothetical protein
VSALTHARINGSIVTVPITRQRAVELFAEAAAHPDRELVGLVGDPVHGFEFWELDGNLQSVRVRVEPVR